MTLSEPKFAKKLIVSLTLRKPKIATAEKRIERMIEIMRRVLAFLKRAKKKLRAVRITIPAMTIIRYLVGRMLRRKRLTSKATKDNAATQARILVIRFNLFLVGLDCFGIESLVVVDSSSMVGADSVVGSDSAVGVSVTAVTASCIVSTMIGFFLIGVFLVADFLVAGFLVVDFPTGLLADFLTGFWTALDLTTLFFVVFGFCVTESILLSILIL